MTEIISSNINSVVLIGSGNVAWHLGHAFVQNRIVVKQVISRTEKNAVALAKDIGSDFSDKFDQIDNSADLYVISVSDHAIEEVIRTIKLHEKLFVHTSGSIAMSVFSGYFKNFGVFYPFQTFTKNKPLNYRDIPIYIEGNSPENKNKLMHLASCLSDNVKEINSEDRALLHLAAVFANNFTNHMVTLANSILQKMNIDFSVLQPLLKETISKLDSLGPENAQTGPAVRNDRNIIEKHLKMLEDMPQMRDIYSIVSESIKECHKKD